MPSPPEQPNIEDHFIYKANNLEYSRYSISNAVYSSSRAAERWSSNEISWYDRCWHPDGWYITYWKRGRQNYNVGDFVATAHANYIDVVAPILQRVNFGKPIALSSWATEHRRPLPVTLIDDHSRLLLLNVQGPLNLARAEQRLIGRRKMSECRGETVLRLSWRVRKVTSSISARNRSRGNVAPKADFRLFPAVSSERASCCGCLLDLTIRNYDNRADPSLYFQHVSILRYLCCRPCGS